MNMDFFDQSATLRMLNAEGRNELIRRAPANLTAAIAEAVKIDNEQRQSRTV